jgi:outer membrane receptor protein involved in Fe transport
MILSRRFLLAASGAAVLLASTACGEQTNVYDFDQPVESLKDALRQVTRIAGIDLYVGSDDVAGRNAPALHGAYSTKQALDILLAGTGLEAEISGRRAFVRPIDAIPPAIGEPADIVVTGSRIRGAPIASPVIALGQAEIRDSGRTTLGEAVRTLPQNFSGGQNPGIAGNGSQGDNTNFNSSSTINLRGLGPDATLTLLNGHRVAYDSYVQGIDIDAIPLAALDRIEIVPDGASALYGSDAVGGVANIILKRDYDGASLSAHVGAATDGGGARQDYSAVAGRRWSSGGFIAVADYAHDAAINADDRSIASNLSPDQTLYPAIRHESGIIAGHQSIGRAEFSIDAAYSHRTSALFNSYIPPEPYDENGFVLRTHETSFEISPKITLPLGGRWQSYISGTYGRDRSRSDSNFYSSSVAYLAEQVRFYDSTRNIETGADGPIAHLFGKDVRVALGGGYRSNALLDQVVANGTETYRMFARQTDYYAFGELNLPMVAPSDAIDGINSLSLSAAGRFEAYRHSSHILTPKFGLIYRPVADVALKGSWGRSFKAPTLEQQFSPPSATVLPAYYVGSAGPLTDNVLLVSGGNRDLKPERAETWTATAEWTPSSIPGLTLQASYFHTRYAQRVIAPISSFDGVLTNPIYRDFVTSSPTAAAIEAIAISAPGGIVSGTGAPWDPSSVIAIVDDRNHNAARQIIDGIDAQVGYRLTLAGDRSLALTGSASHTHTRQQLGPDQATTTLSGRIYRMPSWNAHGSITYSTPRFTLNADAVYIGGLLDDRFAPFVAVGSMTTVNLTGTAHLHGPVSLLNRVDVTLSVQNLLDAGPDRIRSTAPNSIPYDSSNYSAAGRFVSFTVTKSF